MAARGRASRLLLLTSVLALCAAATRRFLGLVAQATMAKVQGLVASAAQVEEVVNVTRALVDIESVSGNEKAVADHLASLLESEGYTVERQVLEEGKRENLLAYRPGHRLTRLVINSHIDTVPPFFASSEDDTYLYGRGCVDAKGQIAPQLLAVRNLRSRGAIQDSDVSLCGTASSFLYVVGEEVDHAGMKFANELNLQPEFVLVGEPTESKLATGEGVYRTAAGHKGGYKFVLEATGVAAHSGYPELGKSAISAMVPVLNELEAAAWPTDPVLGPTTMNIGLMSGGVAANVVPDYARAEVMIRVSTTVAEVDAIVKNIVGSRVNMTVVSANEPVYCATLPGYPTEAMAYNTDIPYLNGSHVSYLMGPGSITVAHRSDERMDKQELGNHVLLYEQLIADILAQAPGAAKQTVPRRK